MKILYEKQTPTFHTSESYHAFINGIKIGCIDRDKQGVNVFYRVTPFLSSNMFPIKTEPTLEKAKATLEYDFKRALARLSGMIL